MIKSWNFYAVYEKNENLKPNSTSIILIIIKYF